MIFFQFTAVFLTCHTHNLCCWWIWFKTGLAEDKRGVSKDDYNCIINKTPLSSRTNRIIGDQAPSKYLARLQKHAGVAEDEFQNILKYRVLSPELMYANDYESFFWEKILQRIEGAMNKSIPRGAVEIEEGAYIDEDTWGRLKKFISYLKRCKQYMIAKCLWYSLSINKNAMEFVGGPPHPANKSRTRGGWPEFIRFIFCWIVDLCIIIFPQLNCINYI